MSNELSIGYTGSLPVYSVVRRKSDNLVYNGSSFVSWTNADIANYDIPLSDAGGDSYVADLPSVDAGDTYTVFYYEQASATPGTPSITDILLDIDEFYWNGSSTSSPSYPSNWKTILTIIVRNLINDTAATTFTDERIHTAIAVAGLIVAQEYAFDVTYVFDLQAPEITPDPTVAATYDPVASALFSLKAACILNTNAYQSAVGKGIKVRDGDSEVDTTGSFKGYKDIIEVGPCGSYTKLLKQMTLNKGFGMGRAIFSPVSTGTSGGNGIWHIRGFYDSMLGW